MNSIALAASILAEAAMVWEQEQSEMDENIWACPCGLVFAESSDGSPRANAEHWSRHAALALNEAGLLA